MRARTLVVLLALAATACLPACTGRDEPLTIVLVSLDTTRPDHLSAYGYDKPTTPLLARLATEGTVFRNARSTSSWTLPSHMSLFTGLPPALHDVTIDFQVLDKARRTLGEVFHDAGFRTMGVFSAPYVHPHFGFARGFDFYERATQEPMFFDLTPQQMRTQLGLAEKRSHVEVTSGLVVDRALRLLANSSGDRNLLFLHFFDAHYDYLPPPRLAKRFTDPAYAGPVTGKEVADDPAVHAGMPAEDLAQLEGLYDAEIAWVDENLKRLVEGLSQQGRLDHTLFVVVGDHGEEFFENGRFGHRAGLREEVVRVPMIFWWPGHVAAGNSVDTDVSLVDVLPTLVDLAGLPPEPGVDGRSLRPALAGGSLPPRPTTAELSFFPRTPEGHYVRHAAMVFDGLKVVERVNVAWTPQDERKLDGAVDEDSREQFVYDLRADPGEREDLLESDDPALVARADRALEAFEQEHQRQVERAGGQRRAGPGAAPDIGVPLHDVMKAIGYAASDEAPTPPRKARHDAAKSAKKRGKGGEPKAQAPSQPPQAPPGVPEADGP